MAAPVCHIRAQDENQPYYVSGDGVYLKGDMVIISTTSEYYHNGTLYTFSRWDDGNTDNPRTFTATADVTLRPIYTAAE